MTTWGPSVVADVARKAGWTGEALVDAVALAMAATGGRDHYAVNVVSSPGAERRGLWALRVDEVPGEVVGNLFDPLTNAKAARALWEQCGGAFSWHPAWISGAAANVRPAVVVMLAGGGGKGRPQGRMPFRERLASLAGQVQAMAQRAPNGGTPHVQ